VTKGRSRFKVRMRGASQQERRGRAADTRILPRPRSADKPAEDPEDPQVPQNRKEVDPPRHVRHGPATGGA
jgi:hypothetical protein